MKRLDTLQGTNISHLGKRKIIFKYALSGGYVNSLEGNFFLTLFKIKLYLESCFDVEFMYILYYTYVRLPQGCYVYYRSPATVKV